MRFSSLSCIVCRSVCTSYDTMTHASFNRALNKNDSGLSSYILSWFRYVTRALSIFFCIPFGLWNRWHRLANLFFALLPFAHHSFTSGHYYYCFSSAKRALANETMHKRHHHWRVPSSISSVLVSFECAFLKIIHDFSSCIIINFNDSFGFENM